MKSIQDEIHAFVVANFLYGQDGVCLRDDESLLEGGIVDSTGVLELLAFIEAQYEISVETDELLPENLESIEKVTHFVERKLRRRTAVAG